MIASMLSHHVGLQRRSFLRLAALAAAGVAAGSALDACSSSGPGSSTTAAAPVETLVRTFRSPARGGRSVTYQILLPPGVTRPAGLPVCLVLHGRGDDHRAAVRVTHLDQALATITRQGAPAIALVAVDGGDHTYWHRRSDGDDPLHMITTELLPRLAAAVLRTSRLGLFGWSMGGYGALLLAETLGAPRIAYAAVDSPALWLAAGDSAPGAFDDAADFARNDVFAGRPQLAGVPVRVVCGKSDPFVQATREFVTQVPDLVAAVYPEGGHTAELWTATAPDQLAPLARALA
jgi:enterochelin esterase-like enzyme